MAHRPKYFPRFFTALLATVLATAICLLASAAPAEARVSIVPGAVNGGSTETFAFRLANERSDTTSTRLELVFPQNPPIAFVEVAPVNGWTATITPRPLDPPVKVGDQTISEVAGSIVLDGRGVGPGQFEQFLITMGPLPVDGQLVFEATQSFANGAVERWTNASGQTTPGTPMITIRAGAGPGAPAPSATAAANQGDSESGLADQTEADDATGGGGGLSPLAVLWGALGLAVLIVALVGLRARLLSRRPPEPDHTDEPDETDKAERADAAEVAGR